MAPFDFKSDKHFVASSSDGASHALQVLELTKPSVLLNPSSIRKAHWRVVATIHADLDDDDDEVDADDVNNDDVATKAYDGLRFFDGHGEIEGYAAVTKLAQHLARLRLMVSPTGYCFLEVNDDELGEDFVNFGIHYLRLNDLFSWSHYGVYPATITTWSRSELKYHDPRHEKSLPKQPIASVSKEMHEKLKKLMKKKDEELKKLKEDMDDELLKSREEMDDELLKMKQEKNNELAKLREEMNEADEAKDDELRMLRKEKDEELRKLRKEKDEELRKLSKKHDSELQMLRKGKDGGVALRKLQKENDEELRKLRNEMEDEREKLRNEKDDELEKLENEKDEEMSKRLEEKNDELRRVLKSKDEELQNLGKKKDAGASPQELRKLKDEELQKLIREKDEELRQKLEKKEEEVEKVRKDKEEEVQNPREKKDTEQEVLRQEKAAELATLRAHLSSKNSWALLPSHKLLNRRKDNALAGRIRHMSKRYRVPPQTFIISKNNNNSFVGWKPTRSGVQVCVVDEDTAWPLPKVIHVYTTSGEYFDINNWWCVKTTNPDNIGLTMFAYYDGDYRTYPTNVIPVPSDLEKNFFSPYIVHIDFGLGTKIGFQYRE